MESNSHQKQLNGWLEVALHRGLGNTIHHHHHHRDRKTSESTLFHVLYHKLHSLLSLIFTATCQSCLKPGSHMSPTYLRHSCCLQQATFSDLFQSVPASVLKLARNVNQIGAILTIPSVNMDRTVLLECQFQLALIIVMRYVRRKQKMEKMRTGCDQRFKG